MENSLSGAVSIKRQNSSSPIARQRARSTTCPEAWSAPP
jgi:hypothetical protein